MNRRILLFLLMTVGAPLQANSSCPSTTFIGTISFPSAVTLNPNLPTYYKGAHIEMNNSSYEIKESICSQEFFVLFTLGAIKAQSQTSEDCNTICNLTLPATAPYKCYKISHSLNPSFRFGAQKPLTWNIESVKLSKQGSSMTIPDNTIIMLANPNYIDGLEQDQWKSMNSTYRLPKIVFKENVSEKSLESMTDKAFLVSLDLKAFHRKPSIAKEHHLRKPALVTSMVIG